MTPHAGHMNEYSSEDYDDHFSDGDAYDVSFTAKTKKQPSTQQPRIGQLRSHKSEPKDADRQPKKAFQPLKGAASKNVRQAPTWISFAGHVDAGKSTLMAQLLQMPHSPDVTPEEQRHGITMELMLKRMEKFVFIDAPGHADLLEVTSKAAALASIIIVVVDPTPDEFERGLGAQTEEHLRAISVLAPSFKHLIFAINKMDKLHWDMARITMVIQTLSALVEQVWKETVFFAPPVTIQYVPLSANTGENVVDLRATTKLNSTIISDNGHENSISSTILEAINRASSEPRDIENASGAFLISVLHTTSGAGSNSFMLEGRVARGTVALASSGYKNVRIYPGAHSAKLSKLSLADMDSNASQNTPRSSSSGSGCIGIGEYLSFSLDIDPSLLSISTSLIVSQPFPEHICEESTFRCSVSFFHLKREPNFILVPGSTFIALVSSISGVRSTPCDVVGIDAMASSSRIPRFLRPGAKGCIRLRFEFPILFAPSFPQIKFLLLHRGHSIAAGIVEIPIPTIG